MTSSDHKTMGMIWTCILLFGVLSHEPVVAQESVPEGCGLVETTYDDPDWVIAGVNRFALTKDICLDCPPPSPPSPEPAFGYDPVFNPCHSGYVRYWKFDECRTAYKFLLHDLSHTPGGCMTEFQTYYVRRGVWFHLYGPNNPDGWLYPPMVGPKFITADCWDISTGCEGLPDYYFFIWGQPHYDIYYWIQLWQNARILEFDCKVDANKKNHHTDNFTTEFVLRRGSTFDVDMRLSREYAPTCYDIRFAIVHNFDGSDTTIAIPTYEGPVPEGEWGAVVIGSATNEDSTETVSFHLQIPANAPVGAYKAFRTELWMTSTEERVDWDHYTSSLAPDPVVVIFNPWSPDDQVGDLDPSQLDEYVLAEKGLIWKGAYPYDEYPIPWTFDQFKDRTLSLVLGQLYGLSSSERADARLVSRHFANKVNANDSDGLLVGKWEPPYDEDSTPAWEWAGTDTIIGALSTPSGGPVKYGQCWNFAGLLTTLLRCVGIPSRPVTNYRSGVDLAQPIDKIVDLYKTVEGKWDYDRPEFEIIWNFHVWCDAYIDGWNAVDGTPVDRAGVYKAGPAPHYDIYNDLGGPYDVDWFFAAVDGDVRVWQAKAAGGDTLLGTNTQHIGRDITTKHIASEDANDITHLYKTPEEQMMMVAMSLSDLEVVASIPETVTIGSDVIWRIDLINTSDVAQTTRTIMSGCAIQYNGSVISPLDSLDVITELAPGDSDSVELVITPDDYMQWTKETLTLEIGFNVRDLSSGEDYGDLRRTGLITPLPALVLSSGEPIEVGDTVTIEARWKNPSTYAFKNAKLLFAVGDGLSIDGASASEIRIGRVGPEEEVSIAEDVTATASGSYYVSAVLWADELLGLSTYTTIVAYSDCNGNDISDEVDIAQGTSQDCNENMIPDECDPDCNDSGIPDDCETRDGLVADCNGNHIPDSCDITYGTSQDVDENGIPDECDPNCDGDGYSDYYEIHVLGTSDGNRNGIPDICDCDCNENGISDELDIVAGTSADADSNMVPDECENGIIGAPMEASGGCGEVTITWIDDDFYDGETGTYQLSRADACPGPYSVLATIDWDDPSATSDSTNYTYIDSTVSHSREFLYKLQVTSTGGQDTAWAMPGCLPYPSVPSTPTNLSGSAGCANGSVHVDLIWDASTGDVDGYHVYRRSFEPIAGCTEQVDYCGTTQETSLLEDDSATPGITYYYGVRAYNSSGVTPLSEQCIVMVPYAEPEIVAGDVDTSTTWPMSDLYCSVLVDDSLTVALGCTLTVKPGTTVYFHGNSNDALEICGHLIADASDTTAITFTSVDSVPSAGDWYGLIATGSSTVILRNCTIKHANHGVDVSTQAPLQSTIEDCTFETNLTRHISVSGADANLDIRRCSMTGSCPTGIFLSGIDGASADVTVEDCEITGDPSATYGILIESGSPLISSNVISGYSTGSAIRAYNASTPTVRGDTLSTCKYGLQTMNSASPSLIASGDPSLIEDCTVGVYTQGSSGPDFRGWNRIYDCATGVHARDTSDPSFRNTLFDGCTTNSVKVDFAAEPDLGTTGSPGSNSFYKGGACPTYRHVNAPTSRPFGVGDVMAEMNWWGTSSPESDCFRGLVDCTPYLASDPNDAGTSMPTAENAFLRPALWQNYPNPFSVITLINYQVPKGGAHVSLRLFDVLGRLVTTLVDKKQPPGRYQISWNGHNGDGRIMPAGVYFCNIEIGDAFEASRKMTLVR